jgi:hypothetical protein
VAIHTPVTVGVPALVTVTAVNSSGGIDRNYTGPVTLTVSGNASSNLQADNGELGFVVVFTAFGNQTVRADDTTHNLTGQTNVVVSDGNGCWWIPIRGGCASTIDQVNAFFGTDSTLSYFRQIKSVYNGASGSANLSADIATLNFWSGFQFTATTNVEAGPSNSPASTSGSGALPTLSSVGSAQAAQNILSGGTVVATALYPVIGYGVNGQNNAGNLAIGVNLVAREGVDIQNFKTGTSTVVNSPPSHTTAQVEGYLSYNAINPPDPSSGSTNTFAGSVFLGGNYGYSYTSHGYALDYGIPKQGNSLGQISAGVVVNGVVAIAISRGFGPSQTYIDSTTNAKTTVNNFKAWSIGISYQKSAPAK